MSKMNYAVERKGISLTLKPKDIKMEPCNETQKDPFID
jgi:hypothetical protein